MNVFRTLLVAGAVAFPLLLGAPSESFAQDSSQIGVSVENHAYLDVHVYAVQDGQRRSLGLVPGISERQFELPRSVAESGREFQVLVNPIGARWNFLTDLYFLYPGEQLNLTLQSDPNLSFVTISDVEGDSDEEPESS